MPNLHSKHSSPLSLRISSQAVKQLEMLCEATGRTKSFLAAQAIERYLEIESWQVSALKETIKKANKSETFLVNHEQVSDWLNGWGTSEEEENPSK